MDFVCLIISLNGCVMLAICTQLLWDGWERLGGVSVVHLCVCSSVSISLLASRDQLTLLYILI